MSQQTGQCCWWASSVPLPMLVPNGHEGTWVRNVGMDYAKMWLLRELNKDRSVEQ